MDVFPTTALLTFGSVDAKTNLDPAPTAAPTALKAWKNPRRHSIADESIVEAFDSLEKYIKDLQTAAVP